VTRFFSFGRKPVGQAPGTIEFRGRKMQEHVRISVVDYTEDRCDERTVADVAECLNYRDTPSITWINVDGLHDTDILSTLSQHYGLHPLVQEDIVNTQQRPKVEDFGDYLYIVCRMLRHESGKSQVESEQVSLVLGPNFILSFQEMEGDVFEPVRARLRAGKGRIRKWGADYLAYTLLDAVVDNYFHVLENFSEEIEILEEMLLDDPAPGQLSTIHAMKREMVLLRRAVSPLRELVGRLERGESSLIDERTRPFLRDVYDHVIQVSDGIDSFRDLLSGLQDLYLSSVSNKMNEVMKVLTIIGTIFIPLTFVAGIYGMNFEHMPELGWKWSYAIFWAVILGLGGLMFSFFRRRRWL